MCFPSKRPTALSDQCLPVCWDASPLVPVGARPPHLGWSPRLGWASTLAVLSGEDSGWHHLHPLAHRPRRPHPQLQDPLCLHKEWNRQNLLLLERQEKVQCLSNSSTTQLPMPQTNRILLIVGGNSDHSRPGSVAVELYPAAHFRPPWICHNRLRPASFVTESGILAVCGGDFGGWSSPPVDTCEVLDSNTQQWRVDYRVPSVPQNISCQLFSGQSDCVRPARVHWTDSVTLPGIGVFLFGKPSSNREHGERTLSVLLRTGSTSWVPTPGWIEPRQLRMDPPRGWSCIVALPKTNSILVIPDGRGWMDGRTNVREFRASSGSEPGSWAPDELWPCLLKTCIDYL